MADAIPSNIGKISEPQEKRDTRKPVRWRPGLPADHPATLEHQKKMKQARKKAKKAAKKVEGKTG